MLLGFDYSFKFMFYFFFLFQKAEINRLKKKPVGQNVAILFFLLLFKIGLVGPVDQQINLVSPFKTFLKNKKKSGTSFLVSFCA